MEKGPPPDGHRPGGLWTWKPESYWQAWLWLALPLAVLAAIVGDAFGHSATDALLEGVAVGAAAGVLASVKVRQDRRGP